MKRKNIKSAFLMATCIAGASLMGCGQGNKAPEPLTINIHGHSYDLTKTADSVLTMMSGDDIWVRDARTLETYGAEGVFRPDYSITIEQAKEKTKVGVLMNRFGLQPELETFDREYDAWCKYIFYSDGENNEFTIGNDISSAKTELSDYFDIEKNTFDYAYNRMIESEAKTKELCEKIDKACKLDGFTYISSFGYSSMVQVLFDGRPVSMTDYQIDDWSAAWPKPEYQFFIEFSNVVDQYAHSLMKDDIVVTKELLIESYKDLPYVDQLGLNREMTLINAVKHGIDQMKAGKITSVSIVRIKQNMVEVTVYNKDSKVPYFTPEGNEKYSYLWH